MVAVEGGCAVMPAHMANRKVVSTMLDCAVKGTAATRDFALSMLSLNLTRETLNDKLRELDYSEERRSKVKINKEKRAAKRRRTEEQNPEPEEQV